MSGRIIPLRDGGCAETQAALPWLVSGGLSSVDAARARAHLQACAVCQGELDIERRIRDGVVALPTQADAAWNAFRPRLGARRPLGSSRAFVGWAIAAQLLLLVGGAALLRAPRTAPYHALGATAAPASADILVMFRPATTEARMRSALRAAGARLVDGPTEADAYLLATPLATRKRALAILAADGAVTLAQPIDAGPGP